MTAATARPKSRTRPQAFATVAHARSHTSQPHLPPFRTPIPVYFGFGLTYPQSQPPVPPPAIPPFPLLSLATVASACAPLVQLAWFGLVWAGIYTRPLPTCPPPAPPFSLPPMFQVALAAASPLRPGLHSGPLAARAAAAGQHAVRAAPRLPPRAAALGRPVRRRGADQVPVAGGVGWGLRVCFGAVEKVKGKGEGNGGRGGEGGREGVELHPFLEGN